MPRFERHRDPSWINPMQGGFHPGPPPAAVPQPTAAPSGWQPVDGRPFDGRFDEAVHEISRVLHGLQRNLPRQAGVGSTTFGDVYRTSVDGREVTIANAWTAIETGPNHSGRGTQGVAVCAVELPSILPVLWVRPRRFSWRASIGESRTGNPAFDGRYEVIGVPARAAAATGLHTAADVLTPEVQQRILARDDWVFHAERLLLGCVSRGSFGSLDEAAARASEVLGIVSAIPASVLPSQVDHSTDDVIARFAAIDNVDDAIAALQHLTPAERDQLARSSTPLAAFADVKTPEEAMARFGSLDPQSRMQVLAMFMRAQGR